MYRILVVDNEPYVVDWIAMLMEEQIHRDIDVCRAYTAAEALEWLVRSRIDIVISDICMPRMDGLELAEQVKKRWPFAKVILITAHAQFDYAVTAIKNNVASYILKTQGDDVIISEVRRVMTLMEQELNQIARNQQRADLELALPELRSSFFRELLIQGEEEEERIRMQLEALRMFLDVHTPVWLILCSNREWETAKNLVVRQESVLNMITLMEAYVGDCGHIYPVDLGGSRMAWILKYEQGFGEEPAVLEQGKTEMVRITEESRQSTLIQGRLEMLQDACEAGSGEHVSFILHSRTVCMGNLREAYRSMEILMNRMARERESFVIYSGEEFEKWKVDTEVISRRMGLYLEEENYEKFLQALSYYQRLAKEGQLEKGDYFSIYYSIALLINFYLEKREITKTEEIAALESRLFIPSVDGEWEKKFQELIQLSGLIFTTESEMKNRFFRNTVEAVKKYILEHIAEDVSLTRLGEITGYNTCYLSRVFKAQTGETLTEYIGRKKIERIRLLMQDEKLNIGEIAEQSGFISRTYFNRFVRKCTGMSPKDYRLSLVGSVDNHSNKKK